MDVLSDILGTLRLRGGVHFRCEFASPWGMAMESTTDAPFHIVVRGNFWLRVPDRSEPIALHAGDLVVMPRGGAHALLDSPDRPARPVGDVVAGQSLDRYGPVVNEGDGQPASILCGYFRFDRSPPHPLLDALPALIHVKGTDSQDLTWLNATLNFMIHETRAARPGAEAVVDRMAAVLFIHVLRAYVEGSDAPSGMLAAFTDRQVGAALELMHRRPGEAWTLEALARQVGMSRSVFAARFHQMVRQPPLQYLTLWRMQVARAQLVSTRLSLARIAEQVGYRTEASFSKTFRRIVGTSPGQFRKRERSPIDGEADGGSR
jgi:AraC-like DNA-binding protein